MKRSHLLWLLYGASVVIAGLQSAFIAREPIGAFWFAEALGGGFGYWLVSGMGTFAQRRNPPNPWWSVAILTLMAIFSTIGLLES